jgi:hypothetical protein
MTLPLMRVSGGRLNEAVPGANVPGSGRLAGMKLDEARARAQALEARIRSATSQVPDRRRHRYFVTQIGARTIADPTRLWIDYDSDLRTASRVRLGGVTGWFDGCPSHGPLASRPAPAISGCTAPREDAVSRAARWIDANGLPDGIIISGPVSEGFGGIEVPVDPPVTLRAVIR